MCIRDRRSSSPSPSQRPRRTTLARPHRWRRRPADLAGQGRPCQGPEVDRPPLRSVGGRCRAEVGPAHRG
eukprot:2846405-Alexandrium_andersonii.AAC.1